MADTTNGQAPKVTPKRRRQDMYQTATTKAIRLRRAALVATLVAVGLVLPVLLAGLVAPPAQAASHTFTVTTTADIGDATPDGVCDSCSLREAIQEADFSTVDNISDVDRINFAIPPTDPIGNTEGCADDGICTILLASPLPPITDPVVVNGYSQPGSSVNTLARGTNAHPVVEITPTAGFPVANHLGGLTVGGHNITIKGLVINRFSSMPGIELSPFVSGQVVSNVKIQGNFIGTDPSGTLDEGNGLSGVNIEGASNVTVGGTTLASRNLISGNAFRGVSIFGATNAGREPANDNVIRGNLIGTQKDAIKPLGNAGVGVSVIDTSFLTNGTHDANGNTILSNSIFANGLGIDLGGDLESTANDAGDADAGANRLQNKPTLSSAKTASGTTTVKGALNSRPNEFYTVQFFSSPSGGQGRTFVGQKVVKTDGSGKASFTFSPASKVAVGQRVTATATRTKTGDTSEFSGARTVTSS
jgi:CSLREA domain-containing protein